MSTTTTTKVRLVRCPKCRLVLPEMPNIPVYQCGGCFTTLQAKSQRQTVPSSPGTIVEENNNLDHVPQDKASSSLSHETPLQCPEICHSDQNAGMGQTESGDIISIANLRGKDIESENESNMSDQKSSEDGFDDGEKLEHNLTNGVVNEDGVPHNLQVASASLPNQDHNSDSQQHDSSSSNENHLPEEQEIHENGELMSARTQFRVEDNGESSSFASKIEADKDVKSPIDSTDKEPNKGEIVNTKGSQERTLRGLDRMRSTETVYISSNEQLDQFPADAFDPSSELSSALIDLSKSPTTRSSRAYYDDGISSHEGTDDQLHNRHRHGSKHAHRASNNAAFDVRKDRVPVSSNDRAQPHFRSSASIPGRNWTNLERDEYLPHRRIQNEFYYTSDFTSPDRAAHVEQEKLKLLRMVSELQDQLNKATLMDEATTRVNWKNYQRPVYYDHEESFFNSVNPTYSGRLTNWSQQRKHSRIPFSAEAAVNLHHTDHSMSSYPKERNWSAQLPPSGLRYNARSNLYNSHGSWPSSPQHVGPQFHMYSGKAKSDDQMHKDGARKYVREKPRLPQRHLRPLSGGAPFVTCPYCLKLLQLPAEFLLFKRKTHRLKCGACLEVLKFSLENDAHLVPYEPVGEAPPPSEVDEHSDNIHRRRDFSSTSHVTGCPSLSCSDDCKSCSRGNNEKERKMTYLNEARRKGKTPVEYESAGTSHSKMISSEIEELREEAERSNSPLHRLMGYPSARHVLYG